MNIRLGPHSPSSAPLAQASAAIGGDARRLSETERNWIYAALVVVATVAIFAGIYRAELKAGRWNPAVRAVADPAGSAMGCIGIAHFLIAFLFISTSRRMRSWGAWRRFAALAAVGTALCFGYARVGLVAPFLAEMLFFGYFFIHECRDEVFFYFVNGDGPASGRGTALERFLVSIPLLVAGSLAGALVFAILVLGLGTDWAAAEAESLPDTLRWGIGAGSIAAIAICVISLRRRWLKAELGSLGGFLRTHASILRVFAASFAILGVGFLLGWGTHTIVLLHVAAWYVFSVRQLQKHASPARRPGTGSWAWMRGTPAGFTFLHAGLAVLLLLGAGVWAYAFRHDPALLGFKILLDQKSFAYWTIVHVSVSFLPR